MSKQFSTPGNWQTAWQTHAKWLRTVLVARLRDESIADELLQEVAVIAWRKREQLVDSDKVGPWLYRIAIRQIQMLWRKQANSKRFASLDKLPLETADRHQSDPLNWLTSDEAHRLVREALDRMSCQDREILMLKHTEGWTYQQIADRLGISVDKIIYRNSRACQRLRNQLQAVENEWTSK